MMLLKSESYVFLYLSFKKMEEGGYSRNRAPYGKKFQLRVISGYDGSANKGKRKKFLFWYS